MNFAVYHLYKACVLQRVTGSKHEGLEFWFEEGKNPTECQQLLMFITSCFPFALPTNAQRSAANLSKAKNEPRFTT